MVPSNIVLPASSARHGRSCIFQIRSKQPMKQMLAGFATHGESARLVRPRTEPALNSGANHNIFLLHDLAHSHAFTNVSHVRFTRIAEIKIEDHFTASNSHR